MVGVTTEEGSDNDQNGIHQIIIETDELTDFISSRVDILSHLKTHFEEIIVDQLDAEVRDAYKQQKVLVKAKEFRDVKSATQKRVLSFLHAHLPKDKVPPVEFFREVVAIMAEKYEYVYGSDPMREVSPGQLMRRFTFRGTGGPSGLKTLPKIMQQSFRRLRDTNDSSYEYSQTAGGESSKIIRKRRAYVYGVHQDNFYSNEKMPGSELVRKLEQGQYTFNFEMREEIFEANRDTVQNILTNTLPIVEALCIKC